MCRLCGRGEIELAMPCPGTRNEWREALINELVCDHIYSAEHDSNPRKALQDAISWNVQVALDPAVSSDAQGLISRGRYQAECAWREMVDGLVQVKANTTCPYGIEFIDGLIAKCNEQIPTAMEETPNVHLENGS